MKISYQESTNEYGSGWGWESNTYAHAFDQTSINVILEHIVIPDGTPIRYTENGTILGYCNENIEITNGQLLLHNTVMNAQKSCKPNTGNAGNWYSFPATTAGSNISSGNAPNSICPRGWQLTLNIETEIKSWYYLIRNTYNIQDTTNDNKILPTPLSFIHSGNYGQGSLYDRTSHGYYWSSTAVSSDTAYYLGIKYLSYLRPQYTYYSKYNGLSVRCVSR